MAAPYVRVMCGTCGAVCQASLQRLDKVTVQGLKLTKALVYVCDECGGVVATPQITAGRIFPAKEEGAGAAATELRVPLELEDLALCVYAALGLRPSGDVFALPIALGLRQVGMQAEVDDVWRMMDRLDKLVRARPVLSHEIQARLDGLQLAWNAPDRSTVARWLVVAGARSVGVI